MAILSTSSLPDIDRVCADQPGDARLLSAGSGAIFLLAFAISLCAGLFIQLVLLPHILPGLDAGHGLLRGGDWIGFHNDAAAMAQKIARDGWHAFELRPHGQAPVGIAAAVYALTGIHEPWILVPVQAGVFAAAVVGLFNICRSIAPVRASAVAAGLLVVFPSTVLLYAQIHKDVWALAGTIWIVFVGLSYTRSQTWSLVQHSKLFGINLAGVAAVWLVRAYALQIVLLGLVAAIAGVTLWTLFSFLLRAKHNTWPSWVGFVICLLLVVAGSMDAPARLASYLSPQIAIAIAPPNVIEESRPVFEPILVPPRVLASLQPEQKRLYDGRHYEDLVKTFSADQKASWQKYQSGVRKIVNSLTPSADIAPAWVPAALRERLSVLINLRRGEVLSAVSAGSAIDNDVPIRNLGDMIRYVPRALQIALFAPFPNSWSRHGVSPGSSIMIRVAAVEMTVAYAVFFGFVPLLLATGKADKRSIVFLCCFALPILCLLGITIPNVGTLLRMRYAYWYLMLALGGVGWGLAIQHWRRRKAVETSVPVAT